MYNFKKEAKKIARELESESENKYVGAEETKIIEIDNKKYEITVYAFWESSRHLDYYVYDEDENTIEKDSLVEY